MTKVWGWTFSLQKTGWLVAHVLMTWIWVGKNIFYKQWWRIYIHPLKHVIFCRKKGPPGVTLPLVNLKYFWLNLNLSRDLLINLGILSQNNYQKEPPFQVLCEQVVLCKHSDQTGPPGVEDQTFSTLHGTGWVLLWTGWSHPTDWRWFVFGVHCMYPKTIPQFLFNQVHAPWDWFHVCHKPRGCVTVRTTCVGRDTQVHFRSALLIWIKRFM